MAAARAERVPGAEEEEAEAYSARRAQREWLARASGTSTTRNDEGEAEAMPESQDDRSEEQADRAAEHEGQSGEGNNRPDEHGDRPEEAPPVREGFHPGIECYRSGMDPIVGMRYEKRSYDQYFGTQISCNLCQAEFDKLPAGEKLEYERIPPTADEVRDCSRP